MKIESIIKRKKGTVVKMDNPPVTYKFLPENGDFEGPHVAVIEDEGHARLFLRHDEAYRLFEGEAPAPLPEQTGPEPLGSSLVTGETYTITGGDTVDVKVIINMAIDDDGLEVEEWNALSDEDRGQRIKAVLAQLKGTEQEKAPEVEPEAPEEKPAAPAVTESAESAAPDRKDLVEQFVKRFGRRPSNKMKAEDIARALAADDE